MYKLTWITEIDKNNIPHKILTGFDGKYKFFQDRHTNRIRWALRIWPDDGLGLGNHGAEYSLFEAALAAERHCKLREEIGQ